MTAATDERWWVWLRKNGSVGAQVCEEQQPRPARDQKGWTVHRADRRGDLQRERFDPVAGKWAEDPELAGAHTALAIDIDYAAEHGPYQVLIDRVAKEVEARILLGSLATTGRVAREAALRGMPVEELARLIVDQADAGNADLDRIGRKLAAKSRHRPSEASAIKGAEK